MIYANVKYVLAGVLLCLIHFVFAVIYGLNGYVVNEGEVVKAPSGVISMEAFERISERELQLVNKRIESIKEERKAQLVLEIESRRVVVYSSICVFVILLFFALETKKYLFLSVPVFCLGVLYHELVAMFFAIILSWLAGRLLRWFFLLKANGCGE